VDDLRRFQLHLFAIEEETLQPLAATSCKPAARRDAAASN
jgi:hypothetical protein